MWLTPLGFIGQLAHHEQAEKLDFPPLTPDRPEHACHIRILWNQIPLP